MPKWADAVMPVSEWHTPATDYPVGARGAAEIRRAHYGRGYYHLHGVKGKELYQVTKPIPVTSLYVDGQEWMVDDPLHWYGTGQWSAHCRDATLVAGLGLGLVVHQLVAADRVFTVVERNQDVIDLISPHLPPGKYRIVCDDFYEYVKVFGVNYRWLYWDLAVGDRDTPEVNAAFGAGLMYWRAFMPDAYAVFFGAKPKSRKSEVWRPHTRRYAIWQEASAGAGSPALRPGSGPG